jgi:hypothetical protein
MNEDEQIEYGWDDLVQKAKNFGYKDGSMPKTMIENVVRNDNPWSVADVAKVLDSVPQLKDGITKDEYLAYSKYDKFRRSQLIPCVPKFSKWSSDSARNAEFKTCAPLASNKTCVAVVKCEWMEPDFNPHNEWKELVKKAGQKEDTKYLPTEKYLETAKQMWPEQADRMDKWVKEAEKQDPQNFDMGEYMEFRNYIHKVKEVGCVLGYKTFKGFEGKDGTQPKIKEQFAENTACTIHKKESACVSPCFW